MWRRKTLTAYQMSAKLFVPLHHFCLLRSHSYAHILAVWPTVRQRVNVGCVECLKMLHFVSRIQYYALFIFIECRRMYQPNNCKNKQFTCDGACRMLFPSSSCIQKHARTHKIIVTALPRQTRGEWINEWIGNGYIAYPVAVAGHLCEL